MTHQTTLTIGRNIERLIADRGLNKRELGERVGLGKSLVYDICSGRTHSPTVETIDRIASALGVTMLDLLLPHAASDDRMALLTLFWAMPPAERERLLRIASVLTEPSRRNG